MTGVTVSALEYIVCVLYLIAAPSEPTTVHEISESEMVIEECEGSELL